MLWHPQPISALAKNSSQSGEPPCNRGTNSVKMICCETAGVLILCPAGPPCYYSDPSFWAERSSHLKTSAVKKEGLESKIHLGPSPTLTKYQTSLAL